MRVLLVDGSSRKNGCTNAVLCEVEQVLNEEGIETEQFFTEYMAIMELFIFLGHYSSQGIQRVAGRREKLVEKKK